jgi:O-antigen/teichoic acid export membrane protein
MACSLLALLAIRAVTTFLTPEQYGEFALLLTVQSFFGLFLVNPVGQHINLHTHAWWDDGSLLARLKSYSHYILLVALMGGLAMLIITKHNSVQQGLLTSTAMFAMVVTGTWNSTLIPMLNMLGFRGAAILWSVITAVLSLVCAILLVLWLPSATAWFAGQTVGLGMGAIGAKYVLHKNATRSVFFQKSLSLIDKKTVFHYCFPLALATGLMWLQLTGYRFLVEKYWGLAQLGFLAIGLQLASNIFALAESLAMQFLYPLFYRRVTRHDNRTEVELALSDLLNTLVPLYLVLAGLVILSAPYLLKILVAPQFQDAVSFVMLGAGIELCRVLGNVFSNAAHIKRKTTSLALPYFVGALVTLSLIYYAGIRQEEIIFVGTALIGGAMAMFLVMAVGMYKQVKFSLDIIRFSVGILTLIVMAILSLWVPKLSGIVASVVVLTIIVALSAIVMLVLLWKNPATLRLLSVQLRNH